MTPETIGKIVAAAITVIGALIGLITKFVKGKNKPPEPEGKGQPGQVNSVGEVKGQSIQIDEMKGNIVMSTSESKIVEEGNSSNKEKGIKVRDSIQATHIKLSSTYTSIFAEDGQLQSETIHIEQTEEGVITGKVELRINGKSDKSESKIVYTLQGTFDNKVLTGEYYSVSESDDERGTINLKLISKDVLSGFCSFSKTSPIAEDGIRMSPYVWVAGEGVDLINGSYSFCAECYKESVDCCCASEEVDMPILLDNEASIIQNTLPSKSTRKKSVFSTPISHSSVRQIKREEVDDETKECKSKCYFFDCEAKKCRIYSKRPVDCRLFPFDIVLNKNTGEYEVGYYTTLCNRNLPEYTQMKEIAHILRPYFFLLYPYAHIITTDTVCERLKTAEFQKIAVLRDFVF